LIIDFKEIAMAEPTGLVFNAEELGYSFLPAAEPHDIGYAQLNVVLRPAPTEQHYDPEVVACAVAIASGGVMTLRVHHPWILDATYRVCVGHIRLEDRKGKQVTAFTFGGELHIDSDAHHTLCRFISPAPILEHSREHNTLEVLLSEEVEVLFAERRAAARHNDDDFERRLAAADPLQLYWACLATLRDKIDRWPAWEEPLHLDFKHFLHKALAPQSAEAPIEIPALTDLL
jgi:hypothetical protein